MPQIKSDYAPAFGEKGKLMYWSFYFLQATLLTQPQFCMHIKFIYISPGKLFPQKGTQTTFTAVF